MRQCTAVKDAFSAVDEAHRMSVLARSVNVQGGLGNRALSLLGNRALSLLCSLWVRARRAGRARDPPNTRPPRPRPPAPVPTAPCLHRPPSARPAPAHHPEGATRHLRPRSCDQGVVTFSSLRRNEGLRENVFAPSSTRCQRASGDACLNSQKGGRGGRRSMPGGSDDMPGAAQAGQDPGAPQSAAFGHSDSLTWCD